MGVEFKYFWRMLDKSGRVVAEGNSFEKEDSGDFYLNDDGVYENKETGVKFSGDIEYVDENGNPISPNIRFGGSSGHDATITITNRGGGGSSASGRAFGEIRSNLGSGVSPAFEQAIRSDKSKIENPEKPQPDTPTPPPNNVGSGGSLIGEIAKQNDILSRLVSKIGQNTGVNKISRGLGSLERAFKSSLENVSNNIKEGANTIALNSGSNKVSVALNSVNENLSKIATVKDDLAKISENGKGLLDIEKDRHSYEKTPQAIKDLDGETVANLSPRDAQTANNATQAKKNTDINNFELLDSDIEDLFGDLPDITGLFDIELPGETLRELIN